jgi:hypothetical protein
VLKDAGVTGGHGGTGEAHEAFADIAPTTLAAAPKRATPMLFPSPMLRDRGITPVD